MSDISNAKTYNRKVVDFFYLYFQYMESPFWIKEVEYIDPEIQTTQKFLGHKQIEFQYRLGTDNYVFWNSHN